MDMNSLIHRGSNPSIDGFRAPATAYPNPALPGLRTHLPSLPIRLPALHPTPPPSATTSEQRRPDMTAGATHDRPSSSHQASSLAPLRFIIPSSHCVAPSMNSYSSSDGNVNIRPAGSGPIKPDVPLSINTSHSYSDAAGHSHEMSYRLHVGSKKSDVSDMSGEANLEDSGVDDLGRSKKSPGKRSRAVKNPNRSTKSKARPGLRKGKWTEEEERYATQLTTYFKEGLLPIERGTMLRLYLSQKLNCEPMRITKKFTGGECIGKQVFRPCSPTPESRVRLMQAQLELVALEAAFIKKLKENKEEVPGLTDDTDGSVVTGGMPPGVNQKKRRSRGQRADDDAGFSSDSSSSSDTTISSSHTVDMKRNVDGLDDASAVGLLLDFFYKASRKENDSDASSSKDGNDAGGKTVSSPVAEPDPETDDYVGPMKSANEELASSPIKRMRTLSISNCVTDVTSPKRSRVGSFTIMASN